MAFCRIYNKEKYEHKETIYLLKVSQKYDYDVMFKVDGESPLRNRKTNCKSITLLKLYII